MILSSPPPQFGQCCMSAPELPIAVGGPPSTGVTYSSPSVASRGADDLEDADALLAVIETLEPPGDLSEAVEDLSPSLMLIAHVTRPRRN